MDYKTLAKHIVSALPYITAADLLRVTDALIGTYPQEDVSFTYSPKSLSVKALTLPGVVDAASRGLKINAIKELRAATSCGLKEAKDAIEHENFTRIFPSMVSGSQTGTRLNPYIAKPWG